MDNSHNSMQDNSSVLKPNLSVMDESFVPVANETLKEKHKRFFKRGCHWVGFGAMTLGISFGINFVLFHSNGAFIPFMYILTSLGAVCVMKGLMDIFGGW